MHINIAVIIIVTMEDADILPSYSEATSSDWLPLAAPYIPAKYYAELCLVSQRWYQEFAPRLWRDPLQTVRHLGLDPNDGECYLRLLPRLGESKPTFKVSSRLLSLLAISSTF